MQATKTSSIWFAGLASLTLAVGCVGEPPESPDEGVDPPDVPEQVALVVAGTVMDYFTEEPLANATIDTDGLNPARMASSGPDGAFSLEVDVGSVFFATTALNNYRPTTNEQITVEGIDVQSNLYVLSTPDIERQYATVQVIPEPLTAFLAIDLRDDLGNPLIGVPAAQVQLVNEAVDPPVPVGDGPFFFNELGDIALLADVPASVDSPRGARAAFLNVPEGANVVLIVEADVGGALQTFRVPVLATPDGALLVRTGRVGGADELSPQGRLTFVDTIYPMLQRAAAGGLACANCHSERGTYPQLQFDLAPELVYAQGEQRPTLFIASPDPVEAMQSEILTRPLYEDPPNHPNATFASVEDPRYQLWLQWLVEGAPLE